MGICEDQAIIEVNLLHRERKAEVEPGKSGGYLDRRATEVNVITLRSMKAAIIVVLRLLVRFSGLQIWKKSVDDGKMLRDLGWAVYHSLRADIMSSSFGDRSSSTAFLTAVSPAISQL